MGTNQSIRRGDTFRRPGTVRDKDGVAVDLTGTTIRLTIKNQHDHRDDDDNAVVQLTWTDGGASDGIAVDDPTTGQIVVSLTPDQTDLLTPEKTYRYDVQVVTDDDVFTPENGIVNVTRDTTRNRV